MIKSGEISHQTMEATMSNAKVPDYRVMERIEEILGRLKSGEKLSIKALSTEFGCDTKTIQRDLTKRIPELLQRMNLGVKIGKEGRLFILEGDTNNLKNFEETLVLDTLEKLFKLINFDDFWYLLAEDTTENVINIWFDANSETFEVRLHANKEIVKHLTRRPISKSQRIICTDSDGSVEFSLMITDYREIISEVLKWIPHLFVLSPEELKEYIQESIEEYLLGMKQKI